MVAEESGRNEDISAPFALMFLAFFSLLAHAIFHQQELWGGVNPCSPPILPSSRVISQEVAPSREEDSIEVIEEARQNALHVARQRATKLEALVAREQERCAAESTAYHRGSTSGKCRDRCGFITKNPSSSNGT